MNPSGSEEYEVAQLSNPFLQAALTRIRDSVFHPRARDAQQPATGSMADIRLEHLLAAMNIRPQSFRDMKNSSS